MQGCKKINVVPIRLAEITDVRVLDAGEPSPVGRKALSLRVEWSSEAASKIKKVASYQVHASLPSAPCKHNLAFACSPSAQVTTDGGLETSMRTTVYSGTSMYCEVHDLLPKGRKYLFCVTALTAKGVVEWCGPEPSGSLLPSQTLVTARWHGTSRYFGHLRLTVVRQHGRVWTARFSLLAHGVWACASCGYPAH